MAGSKGKEAFRRPLRQLKTPPGKGPALLSLFPLEPRSSIMVVTSIPDSVPKFGRCWVRRSYRCCFPLLCWRSLSDHVYPAQ
ncbi:uncharacterized protein LACBIDRAFT_307930 [Laccaria bicolor S238N-H82]|uniref:Predicted protein n=1 Tax=Laccaria bicolor (strain S238N-H82 / ATCC MYA-4686) TaxID=486041 RepID=B0DR84_LACBS|nr:uncharacterized protein LACBIDRAFT_307930 [Laccaria bicolor S238N-H82]EDR02738.1 predicted protein [Laccaria bicolor S238N-H82]|eukprot:XP_001886448.1 predicted protein [Laccaria bicolor S238N-H82]